MRTRWLTFLLLPVVLAGAGAASGAREEGARAAGIRLARMASCSDLLAYGRRHALPLVGSSGIWGSGRRPAFPRAVQFQNAGASRQFSKTNVQEHGVDEPDLVKTDGSHLFVAAGATLRVLSVEGKLRQVAGVGLAPRADHQLLLRGSRLLVLSSDGTRVSGLTGGLRSVTRYASVTTLTEIDVTRPRQPRIVRTLTLDGAFVAARMVDGVVRLVTISSIPSGVAFESPKSYDAAGLAAATARNRELLAAADAESWLPRATFVDVARGRIEHRPLVECRQVWQPSEFSGLGLTTVTTLDLEGGLTLLDADAIFSDAEIVYASRDSLLVATERWRDRPVTWSPSVTPRGVRTMLHKFGTGGTKTRYRGSGAVEGYLLSQWSLSEHEGVLRVASTERPTTWAAPVGDASATFVTALVEQGGRLVPVGRVSGIGRGERVHAVRFEGDVGYVVTFRVTDPLYAIDLSRPARPVVRGELDVFGYSAYLHPLGPELLLGVGQEGDAVGTLFGVELSLFDVGDPRRPRRIQHARVGRSSASEVENDHHAFLYWPPAKLVVVPVRVPGRVDRYMAAGYRVDRGGIEYLGKVVHGYAQIRRSVVVGDSLFTVSEGGVKENGLRAFGVRGWVSFENGL
jgi:Beta propeller domain